MVSNTMDVSDAFAECLHNKIIAILANGDRIIIERHWQSVSMEQYTFTLYVAYGADEHYGSMDLTWFTALHGVLVKLGTSERERIWHPLERYNRGEQAQ
jgi:hypothetical protein